METKQMLKTSCSPEAKLQPIPFDDYARNLQEEND